MKTPETLYERERIFNKEDPAGSPSFGVCFSGGGNRSAAFAIGVLRALHERRLLPKVDVISAVSGGSYALSWFLLQPFYHRESRVDPKLALGKIQGEMFDLDGPFQRYLVESAKPLGASSWIGLAALVTLTLPFDLVLFNALRLLSAPLAAGSGGARVANLLNAQSLARSHYREGIQRTYHVFPDRQNQAPVEARTFRERALIASQHLDLTQDDVPPVSFPVFREFARAAGLPAFVFNTTVYPPGPGSHVPLGGRIFELGPMGFGSDSCGYLTWEDTEGLGWELGTPMEKGWTLRASPYATLRNLNLAPAISGAALSSTGGEHGKSSWLLRMLNVGLEYVVPSPADRLRAVRLSDGGHSENLGAYALLRRRCRTILIVDAEHDPDYSFGAYRKLKQAARQELGIDVAIAALDQIVSGSAAFTASAPILAGTITGAEHRGTVYYLKLSVHPPLLGDQAETVSRYSAGHRAFPQEPTSDQYFQPAQFRAYRALGYAIARMLPAGVPDRG